MKSLRRRFMAIAKRSEQLGCFICFARALRGQGFSGKTIRFWFKQLVDSEEYDVRDRRKLLKYLYKLTNEPEAGMIQPQKSRS